jgi:hypothetical protein
MRLDIHQQLAPMEYLPYRRVQSSLSPSMGLCDEMPDRERCLNRPLWQLL